MNFKKVILFTALFSLMMLPLAVSPIMAGGDTQPARPTTGQIIGPDVWGVVIMSCEVPKAALLRVKQIADCEVYTESGLINMSDNTVLNCPDFPRDVLYYQLVGKTIHDQEGNPLGGTGAIPIIVKVKNFPDDFSDTVSFDVLINFWLPPSS